MPKKKLTTGRGNWKYEPEVHIPMLNRIFSQGGDIAAFCAAAKVARCTFQDWRANFQDFHDAYMAAKEVARAWWEQKGIDNLDNPHFNQNVWRLMMRNRFDMTDTRCVYIPGLSKSSTFKGQYNCIQNEVEKGNLTPDEALKLGNFVAVGAKIDQMDSIVARLEAVEAKVCQ